MDYFDSDEGKADGSVKFGFLGKVLKRHGLENLVVTGRIEGRRAKRRQRLKYLVSLCASWKDNVSPTQLIRASENRVIWHRMATTGKQ